MSLSITPAGHRATLLRPYPLKDRNERLDPPIYERWNAFSRVSIWDGGSEPIGWGLSSRMPPTDGLRQKWLTIDGGAGADVISVLATPEQIEIDGRPVAVSTSIPQQADARP